MKRSVFLLVCLLVVAMAMAIPAQKGVVKTIRTADGAEVKVELRGDEFGHFWTSDEGKNYVRIDGSDLYEEVSLESIQEQALTKRLEVEKVQSARRSAPRHTTMGGTHEPYIGNKKCLVILVNFANSYFLPEHDLAYYQGLTNTENFTDDAGNTHSVRDYFRAQSYDLLDIEFDVAGPVQLEYDYSHYGGTMRYVDEMVIEAINGAHEEGFNFADYDWDGDGEVEQIFILYAGYNAATYEDDDLIWPHMSSLGSKRVTYDGVTINTYACSSELAGSGYADGIGTMCHEFSHCMGLPDVYDTQYGSNYGMSYWSLMDMGCYNGTGLHNPNTYSGYMPAGYTSYERMYCGWLDPVELTEETEISGMKGLTEGGDAYIIYNPNQTNEYYLLENRTAYDFDSGLFGTGLLIVHMDYAAYYWGNNVVNSFSLGNDHERYALIASDNSYVNTIADIAADAWPSGTNRIDNNTTPGATAFNRNTDGSYYMNISITKITQEDDGTISFRFYPAGVDPQHGNRPEGAIFYESFDYCAGLGGNDGNFSSSTGAAAFEPDNDGWSSAASHGADQCAMFGSDRQAGNVVTPTFTIDGETVLSFKAAPITARIEGLLVVSCETGNATLSETEFALAQDEWTDISLTLDGTGDVSLRMKETSGIGRFFLDEVAAVPADALAGIATVGMDAQRHGVYSLEGIYLGESAEHLKRGIYIIDGKKCIIK